MTLRSQQIFAQEHQPLNIARFKAAYLTVDMDPWRRAAHRVRADLSAEGRIDDDFVAALAAASGAGKDTLETK